MILCVALNAALDVTYTVDGVRWHAANRINSVAERAGGKATNVARVLRALGDEVLLTGFAAGDTGEHIRRDLAGAGIAEAFLRVPGRSRRTVAVVDTATGDATGFWEPGPDVSASDWSAFLDHYHRVVREASGVVLSGSTPGGLPPDAYAQLVSAAHDAGVPAVLDADGAALRLGAAAGPEILKPNIEELRAATGLHDVHAAADLLLRCGAGAVVVSAGADGLLACTARHRWTARPPDRLSGNPIGAGDACVAALARGLVSDTGWPERLAEAVALSASAVLGPLAGDVDLDTYRSLRHRVEIREI